MSPPWRPSKGKPQGRIPRPLAIDDRKGARLNPDPSLFRALPSVDRLVQLADPAIPAEVAVRIARRELASLRADLQNGRVTDNLPQEAERRFHDALRPLLQVSLRRVLNATGVLLHTNLGRASLDSLEPLTGYSNLEYDLVAGRRGKRDAHLAPLLEALLDRRAIVVNNNAAAVYLVLHELAAGYEVIVSRGELIEIGDGFRIPDIMAHSGAILREVGTTNRTRIEDYRDAINERTRAILRVHPSNFHIDGFTAKPALNELSQLAAEHKLPLYEDLGSGCVVDLRGFGVQEPLVQDSFNAGVPLLSFSTDKLLGGPQSGIIAGSAELVERIRRNPMYRAFRVDKLIIQALEETLRNLVLARWDRIPTIRMLAQPAETIRTRAERFLAELQAACPVEASVVPGHSLLGGGSTPDQSIPSWLIAIRAPNPVRLERVLRQAEPPVIARLERDQLLIDLRSIAAASPEHKSPGEEPALHQSLTWAIAKLNETR
jgi:L-seryl-tRNA(Ser) seleniumtransferase